MRAHAIRNLVLLADVVIWGFVVPSLAVPAHALAAGRPPSAAHSADAPPNESR